MTNTRFALVSVIAKTTVVLRRLAMCLEMVLVRSHPFIAVRTELTAVGTATAAIAAQNTIQA
ncbi:MAG: hypothetical protein FWG16_00935 [Micrococcales bacterium]|nr:hypothetical protein [Micrococcales bacterium]